MENKNTHRVPISSYVFYVGIFVISLFFFFGLYYNLFLRNPSDIRGILISLIGGVYLLFISFRMIIMSYRYRLELSRNEIKEFYGSNLMTSTYFESIEHVKRVPMINLPMFIINPFFKTYSTILITGLNKKGEKTDFYLRMPLSLNKLLLYLREIYPNIIIDNSFNQYLGFAEQKKVYGKISKERLFLLIFLIITVVILPIIFFVYLFTKKY